MATPLDVPTGSESGYDSSPSSPKLAIIHFFVRTLGDEQEGDQVHRGGKAIPREGQLEGRDKETAEYRAMGTITSVRFLEGKRSRELVRLSATAPKLIIIIVKPRVCRASQNYLVSLQQPREVSIIIIIPNFALKKEKAVGRKFNQGDKGCKWRRREANSGHSWRQGSAHLKYHKGGDAYCHHRKEAPSIKPQSPLWRQKAP